MTRRMSLTAQDNHLEVWICLRRPAGLLATCGKQLTAFEVVQLHDIVRLPSIATPSVKAGVEDACWMCKSQPLRPIDFT